MQILLELFVILAATLVTSQPLESLTSNEESSIDLSVSSNPPLVSLLDNITSSDTSQRIVNGYEISIDEIPYQVAIRRKVSSGWTHMCGGVIITIMSVLTAAHCGESYISNPSYLRVVAGTSYRLSGGKTYDVSDVVVHEDYNANTLENDIALLVTAKKMSFGRSIKPISFANPDLSIPAGTEALVSGYGTTSYEGSASTVLLAAKVYVTDQTDCVQAYRRIATIYSGMICATASDPPRDACQGDSGGPLVAHNHVIGIVSFGEGCAESVYPGVYTRVSEYAIWIHEKLSKIQY